MLRAYLCNLLLSGFVAGVDFDGTEKLNQRSLLVARFHQISPLGDVQRGVRETYPEVGGAIAHVRGRHRVGSLIIRVGGIVVAAASAACPCLK